MEPISQMIGIADEIRLSIAPVFLLTALAGFTTIMTGRLTRSIDRARTLAAGEEPDSGAAMALIRRRLRLVQWAIRCFAGAAIVVCVVVVCIFLGDYLLPDLSGIIGVLFMLAMALTVAGLLFFFAEIGFAVQNADERSWD